MSKNGIFNRILDAVGLEEEEFEYEEDEIMDEEVDFYEDELEEPEEPKASRRRQAKMFLKPKHFTITSIAFSPRYSSLINRGI